MCTSCFFSLLLYHLSCSTSPYSKAFLIFAYKFLHTYPLYTTVRTKSRFPSLLSEMSRPTVELDFFGMERKENSANSSHQFQKCNNRQRSFRDIQSAISKIDPEIIKSVIASGSVGSIDSKKSPISLPPSTPKEEAITFPAVPLYRHFPRPASENVLETAPLTIFYNGTVAVFDVPRDKAECILKLAVEGNSKAVESMDPNVAGDQQQLLETFNTGDLPIARRKSLQRFLEKRKERLTSASPYSCHAT